MKFKFIYVAIYSVFMLMALGALIGGGITIYKNLDLKNNGVQTLGVVVDASRSSNTKRSFQNGDKTTEDHFFPIIEYKVKDATLVSQTHSAADNQNIVIGDEVSVVYRPNEPDYVELQALLMENVIAGIVGACLGLIFTSVLTFFGIRVLRLKKAELAEQQFKEDNHRTGTSKEK
jgi:hypothetical protein